MVRHFIEQQQIPTTKEQRKQTHKTIITMRSNRKAACDYNKT